MKTIVEQPKFINVTLGKQNIDSKKTYRPIQFLVFSEFDGSFLVYNTLTKHLILVDEEEYNILSGKKFSPFNEDLIESYFLVPIEYDEKMLFEQLKNLFVLFDNDDSITSYIILPTTDCNARCFYCCENGQKRIHMSSKTALDIAKFIEKSCKGKEVTIMWFGGEPLYNIEPINIISDYLRKNNIPFKSNMISNSYLFDDQIIDTAKTNWNLKSVQITLDGTEQIYNRIKAYIYKDGVNPYKKVIDNIGKLANNQIKAIVRLNMDLYNKDNLYQLVDELYNLFGDNKNVIIYVRMLFDNTSKIQTERSNDERKKLFEEFQKFEDYIASKGMFHNQKLKSLFTLNSCIGTNKHGTVIMPNGELGMCDLHTDSDLYGNIYEGITNQKVIDDFLVYKKQVDSCKTCPILPNCFRLEKCLYYTRDCEIYEQDHLIKQLRKHMNYTYKCWKEKGEKA